jgi:hypothetical protein
MRTMLPARSGLPPPWQWLSTVEVGAECLGCFCPSPTQVLHSTASLLSHSGSDSDFVIVQYVLLDVMHGIPRKQRRACGAPYPLLTMTEEYACSKLLC